MSVLDSAIHVGKESTYGTPATLTRSFEGKADSFKREQERIESVGFRAGMETVRTDRVVTVNMGGAGALEVDVLNIGMGLLLEGLLGATSGPTQVAATSAYDQAHTSTSAGPNDSYTIQVVRPYIDGTAEEFTHHGCVATGWSISQSVGGLLTLNIDFDFEDVDYVTAAGSATYPASSIPFSWKDATVTIDGTSYGFAREFGFEADLALKTDRRYLRGSELKRQPIRNGVPRYSGNLSVDWEDENATVDATNLYDDFVAGSIVDLQVKWAGATDGIETGYEFEFEIDLPAIQFTGESPETSISDLPVLNLPFQVLDNGTDPAVTVNVRSTDTAL